MVSNQAIKILYLVCLSDLYNIMNVLKFPLDARWVPGKKEGLKVLVDPYGNRLIKKSEYGENSFYWCGRKDLKCPVRLTLNTKTNCLVSARGEHNHDSDKMKQAIETNKRKVIENSKTNLTLAPRVLFKDLTNSILSSPTKAHGIGSLPKPRSLAKTINQKRKLSLGSVGNLPRMWSEYIVPDRFEKNSGWTVFLNFRRGNQ